MEYKSTLNLPKTPFPMKADLPKREPDMLQAWETADLYGQIRQAAHPAGMFLLHDGPPYANGDIHIGHALNKILKDLIVRYKTMRGFDAPYIPGWDCHGMPIEHALFKELKLTKHQIDQTAFRGKARAYADKYVGIQREQFKRLGVLGDWAHPYLTMAPEYELAILRVFRELVQAGYVYRGKKPVYWCATCETALAEAEVEYEDRKDASIFVKFPVLDWPGAVPAPLKSRPAAVAVWTTTPWTLPANVALAFHPDAQYVLLRHDGWAHDLLVAEPLAGKLADVMKAPGAAAVGSAPGKALAGMVCEAPFGRRSVAVTDGGVSMSEGTGVVHIAPGHGHEDYHIGLRNKLEVLSPVDHQGRFTKDVPAYAGQTVFDANPKIIAQLKDNGRLLAEAPIVHSYPHCWRCKQPVIFRATPQWFLSVEEKGLRQRLLKAAGAVEWIPAQGISRIRGMLETRPDWCLSRQRYWGTPIPVLHCVPCDQPLLSADVIKQIEGSLAAKGVDAWFTASPAELAPGVKCPSCQGSQLRKETDILDVWFDSGVSNEAVLKARPGLRWPAELYLEGSDQHRGWFQVSLIPAVALREQAPFKSVLTHGFVMDGDGRKMSKSLGNVVAPQQVMEKYGADILRLWVASVDYREDVRISPDILEQVADSYRKIRNTFRYLLANLYDFNPKTDRVNVAEGPELDRWAADQLGSLQEAVTRAYETSQFHEAVKAVHQFCVLDLSAFYLDALKDRLYTESPSLAKRRCAQTVLYDILDALVRILAPILAVTADEVWQLMRASGWVTEPSVHLAAWPRTPDARLDEAGKRRWTSLLALRDTVMKALEEQRAAGQIRGGLDARVTLAMAEPDLQAWCLANRETLAEAFVVSQVDVLTNGQAAPGVKVEPSTDKKCERCWRHLPTVGRDAEHPTLCERCTRVVAGRA